MVVTDHIFQLSYYALHHRSILIFLLFIKEKRKELLNIHYHHHFRWRRIQFLSRQLCNCIIAKKKKLKKNLRKKCKPYMENELFFFFSKFKNVLASIIFICENKKRSEKKEEEKEWKKELYVSAGRLHVIWPWKINCKRCTRGEMRRWKKKKIFFLHFYRCLCTVA